MDSGLN